MNGLLWLLWVVVAVAAWLVIGWVGAMTWMRGLSNREDPIERGMDVLFSPVIGFWLAVMGVVLGIGWLLRAAVRTLGRAVPHG